MGVNIEEIDTYFSSFFYFVFRSHCVGSGNNPNRNTDGAETASKLNPVGEYLLSEVMMTKGKDQGLYCTHCHNMLSRELYKADHLTDATNQTGKTLRNQPLEKIADAFKMMLARKEYFNKVMFFPEGP